MLANINCQMYPYLAMWGFGVMRVQQLIVEWFKQAFHKMETNTALHAWVDCIIGRPYCWIISTRSMPLCQRLFTPFIVRPFNSIMAICLQNNYTDVTSNIKIQKQIKVKRNMSNAGEHKLELFRSGAIKVRLMETLHKSMSLSWFKYWLQNRYRNVIIF